MTLIKMCSADLPGKAEYHPSNSESLRKAVEERVDNLRVARMQGLFVRRAVVEKFKLWENGRTLRIRFMDGDLTVIEKVRRIAKEWEEIVNLKFEWVSSGDAEIRISFADQGYSWSYVGTDALFIPQSEPTMNYGWLYPSTDIEEYERVVRHEFGHALGLGHEHQNPNAKTSINWDLEAVYAYYARQGWTREDVDYNVLGVYDTELTNFSLYDPASIMHYPISDSLTLDNFSVGWNTRFSRTDVDFMRLQYPKTDVPSVVELPVNDNFDWSLLSTNIATGGEVDVFHFRVPRTATYIMKTEGALDTMMTLFGPDDQTVIMKVDDNTGYEANARITRKLTAGHDYWLSVHHKEPLLMGDYAVGIKMRKCWFFS